MMTDTIADQIAAGIETYDDDAWLRETVEFFRPVISPDDNGGSTITVPVIATGTVMADPIHQDGRQTMLVKNEDATLIRVGDLVRLEHSQFRT